MPKLSLFEEYNRLEIHSIFSPNTVFTPNSGTWGILGIVSIPARPGDYIFYVTYGQQQGQHTFEEGITEQGVLSWQTQPSQSLRDPKILQFINHNELKNVIYLFLRTSAKHKYTYLGRLKYLSHDTEREKPVYFQWQLLEWPTPIPILKRMGLTLLSEDVIDDTNNNDIADSTNVISNSSARGVSTKTFRPRKSPDYSVLDANNRQLGLSGELFIMEYEQKQLKILGRTDLAEKVRHISLLEGDGAGYDILSYSPDGKVKYIEVKTTRGVLATAFYMSVNELFFAQLHSENFYLYRVYDYSIESNTGKVSISEGFQESLFEITPIQYRLKPRR